MVRIINNTQFQIPASSEKAIRENLPYLSSGDKVRITNHSPHQSPEDTIFDVWDEEENYLFSIDTDGDVIFEK